MPSNVRKTTKTSASADGLKTQGARNKRAAPTDKNSSSNISKCLNTSTHQSTGNAQTSPGENESAIEPRMSIDEMAKKCAELQGQSGLLCIHKCAYISCQKMHWSRREPTMQASVISLRIQMKIGVREVAIS
jgi:hypothetical protein